MALKKHIVKILSELRKNGGSADWMLRRDNELFIQAVVGQGGDLQLTANVESTKESDIEKFKLLGETFERIGWIRADGLFSRRFESALPLDDAATFIEDTFVDAFGVRRSDQLLVSASCADRKQKTYSSPDFPPWELISGIGAIVVLGFLLLGWNILIGLLQSAIALLVLFFGGIVLYALHIQKLENPPNNRLASLVSEWFTANLNPISAFFIFCTCAGLGFLMAESAKYSFEDWTSGRAARETLSCESSSDYPYALIPKAMCGCVVSTLAAETHYGEFQHVKFLTNLRKTNGRLLNEDEFSAVIDAEKETMEAARGCVALEILSQGYESANSINRIIDDAYVEMRKRQLQ